MTNCHGFSCILLHSNYEFSTVELLGAFKPNFRRSIRYLLKKFNTDVLAVFETHAGSDRARQICQGLGFDKNFRVDAVG